MTLHARSSIKMIGPDESLYHDCVSLRYIAKYFRVSPLAIYSRSSALVRSVYIPLLYCSAIRDTRKIFQFNVMVIEYPLNNKFIPKLFTSKAHLFA